MNGWLKKHAAVLASLGAIAAIVGLLISFFSPTTPPPVPNSGVQVEGDINFSADNGGTNVINIGTLPIKKDEK